MVMDATSIKASSKNNKVCTVRVRESLSECVRGVCVCMRWKYLIKMREKSKKPERLEESIDTHFTVQTRRIQQLSSKTLLVHASQRQMLPVSYQFHWNSPTHFPPPASAHNRELSNGNCSKHVEAHCDQSHACSNAKMLNGLATGRTSRDAIDLSK